ncbi:MAG: efflux RND transporter permease subunit [Elusimicrobia bacterium]|nr:efflux RND transporter permease subunit [Elusimicrobiota bacterium]
MNRLIDFSARRPGWVLAVFAVLTAWGVRAALRLPIDAVPDITNVQVMVNVKTKAMDPLRIERQVTYPLETELSGLPDVTEVRSLSKYGLAQVVIIFKDGTDLYWARQQVSERLVAVRESLPQGLTPEMAPMSTGLGEVVMYVLRAKPGTPLAGWPEKERLLRLREVQDFMVRPEIKRVPGVADMDVTGGHRKEVHVNFLPERLARHGLTVEALVERLETVGESAGGGYIVDGGAGGKDQVIVRTAGGPDEIERLAALSLGLDFSGQPLRVRDLANVRVDSTLRVGAATSGGEEAVLGIVLMRVGANSREVARDCVETLKSLALPDGIEVDVLYSRSYLVDSVIRTVGVSLAEGAGLVILILLLLLGELRAALLVALAIPISTLFAFQGMLALGVSANLMSLGALDFGLLVDGSVVIIENVLRRFGEAKDGHMDFSARARLVGDAAREVAGPVAFGLAIIMLVYVPVLGLEGVEGKMFRPMAVTVMLALAASLLVALSAMPALATTLLRPGRAEKGTALFRWAMAAYRPTLEAALRRPLGVLGATVAVGALAVGVYLRLGADFVPQLDEGDLVINLSRATGVSLNESIRQQEEAERILASFPEVSSVFSRMGTPESATDPMGIHLADTFVILEKDRARWTKVDGRPRTKEQLFEAMKERLEAGLPPQDVSPNQPIEMRFNEILEGSRADVTVRVFGPDLDRLLELSEQANDILGKVPGVDSVETDPLTALAKTPVMDIAFDHEVLARLGLSLRDANRLVETAMSGTEVGSFYQGAWRYPVIVHLDENLRDRFEQIAALPVSLPGGGTVPLSKIARLERKDQVTTIARQWSRRYAAVSLFSKDPDIAGFVERAKAAVDAQLKLPPGYSLYWGGRFRNLDSARRRLLVVVPATLAGVFLLLLVHFDSWTKAGVVYSAVPFALAGGIFALALRGIPMSVSASVGFIALAGIAILNSMVLVSSFDRLEAEGRSAEDAAREGALQRLRPVLMTALVASLGFVPMAVSAGRGAEVQRPLATVVIGGIVTSTLLTLLVVPALYSMFCRIRRRARPAPAA